MELEEKRQALNVEDIHIDDSSIGAKWTVKNEEQLIGLIANLIFGQIHHAEYIIEQCKRVTIPVSDGDLKKEAIIRLTVDETGQKPRQGYPRYHRDGLLFQCISWCASKQQLSEFDFLTPPLSSATAQGADGVIIEMDSSGGVVVQTTICEDKCSDNPRHSFLSKVIPTFQSWMRNERKSQLLSAASAFISTKKLTNADSIQISNQVLVDEIRRYRAAFALPSHYDNHSGRKSLFADYNKLSKLVQSQRIGASFIVDNEVRDWFDSLAAKVIDHINNL